MSRTERLWRACASVLVLIGAQTAFAQTDIDELLKGLDDLQRTGRTVEPRTAVPPAELLRKETAARVQPQDESPGDFGRHVPTSANAVLRNRFTRRVRMLAGLEGGAATNEWRRFRRDSGSIERDGLTVTLRARFPRETSFATLQRELEETAADLESRFADCGFGQVAVSGNAYLNYVEDVGGLAAFLYAGDVGTPDEDAYVIAVSFSLDFLAPHASEPQSRGAEVRREADFSDRKTVEAMLSTLGRSDFIVRKVKCRRKMAGITGANAFADECAVGLDVGEARERRYEAMKFMDAFVHPCENGFVRKEATPEASAAQAKFVRLVREIAGREILPVGAEAPIETLAEMRRRYHQPTKRFAPTTVDWNMPVNAYRYFPHTPECLSQSPHSATLFACFSAACTRESVWNEMCALARDLERRFAVCGFRPQEVEDGGYVNYRPDVGGIVIHLLGCRNGEESVHMLVLHFSSRLFDWRCGAFSGDWKTERLLRQALTQGMGDGRSVCATCLKRRLRDYCGNLGWMKGAPARGWFTRPFDLPVYERRGECEDWRSVLRPAFPEMTVSCFDEAHILEDLPLDVGVVNVDARREEVAESFYRRFFQSDRQTSQVVPDVALCEICRGGSSWRKITPLPVVK